MPIQMPGFAVLADQPPIVGQPASSPPTSLAPIPPTYPPQWECPVEALGPAQNGFRWGTPYVPAGQENDFTANYSVVAQPVPPNWVLASLTVDAPLMVRCPVVNSHNILTHDVTNWVYPGNTILEWVCNPEITLAGKQLIQDGLVPSDVLDNCGSGGSFDGSPKQ